MKMKWTTRLWEPTLKDAIAVRDLWKTFSPLYTFSPPEIMLERLKKGTKGFEDAFQLILSGNEIIGYIRLTPTQNQNELKIHGGLLPEYRGNGIGRELIIESFKYCKSKDYSKIRCWYFREDQKTVQFMQEAGFEVKDKLLWSIWTKKQEIPAWMKEKVANLHPQGIRIISGTEFSQLHENWDQLWWKHMMTCLQDVPSTIPFEEVPFEKFKKYLYPPFLDPSDSLVAVEGKKLAGILMLSNVQDGSVNINHTSVARSYRRKGISIALKFQAMKKLDGKHIHTLGTQNHEHNPMFQINQSIGFQHVGTQLEAQKILIEKSRNL